MTPTQQIFADVTKGLALEAELHARRDPVSVLWSADAPALVCPAAYQRRSGFTAAITHSAKRGWPVALRPSGGGAVPQGPGIINLAMAITVEKSFAIEDGYRLITEPIRAALARYGLSSKTGATAGSYCDGAWNIAIAGQKIVGTAQRWRPLGDGRIRLLAHALILSHGPVGPGAEAVDAFNRDLDLDPIRADAHTTFEAALGQSSKEAIDLTEALSAATTQQLVSWQSQQ